MFLAYICMLMYMCVHIYIYIYMHIYMYVYACMCIVVFFFNRIFTLQNGGSWAGSLYKGVLSQGRQRRSADKLEPKGTDKSMSTLIASDFNGVAVLWDEVVPLHHKTIPGGREDEGGYEKEE